MDKLERYYVTLYDDHGRFVYFETKRKKFETFHQMTRRISKFGSRNFKDMRWRFATHLERDRIINGEVVCERMG